MLSWYTQSINDSLNKLTACSHQWTSTSLSFIICILLDVEIIDYLKVGQFLDVGLVLDLEGSFKNWTMASMIYLTH